MLTSIHNPRIQLARSLLAQLKMRRESGCFVVEGIRLVEEALRSGWNIRFVLAGENQPERGQALVADLGKKGIQVEVLSDRLVQAISDTETSQGILAVLEHKDLPVPLNPDFILIADQVRDPGNLGSLLRAAMAAGVQAACLPPGTVDAFSPKVLRAGMGAQFHLPIRPVKWDELGKHLEEMNTFLAEMEGGILYWQADFTRPLALIVGGEADGASPSARQHAKNLVSIPMPGRSESLNAATAGAILMFEVVRQRANQNMPGRKP
jgi:TrmH family RNA methyltransferase